MKYSHNRILTTIDTYKVHLIIFGIALFLILGCTLPKIFLNDEWVTTNQLSQLDLGHQAIINEGKYGSFENGTPYKYFTTKSNTLGYSLFLPLISLPALKCINFFGNSFLFFLVEFWAILLIGISLFIRKFFPEGSFFCGYDWTKCSIVAALVLFLCNLVFYQPFLFIGEDTYPEIAAIALTNIVLLAALAVLLYAIYSTLLKSQRISLSATIISICCSSYLFWTTSAKDHMLVAFLFGVLIYCWIKYIYTNDRRYVPAFFIVIGLIAWARTEIAVPLFIAFLILAILKSIAVIRTETNVISGLYFLITPFFTIIGAIPFFINNYIVTGNPFLPPYTAFYQNSIGNTGTEIVSAVNRILPAISVNTSISQNSFIHFFDSVISHYTVAPGTSVLDLLGLLFLPVNRSVAIFVICPVLIIGLAFALLSRIKWRDFAHSEKRVVFILTLISLSLFIAYISGLHGMNNSPGITPDIRYLSPVYLPFNILGILLLKKCGVIPDFSKKGSSVLAFSMIEIALVLIIFLTLFKPPDRTFLILLLNISDIITSISFALIILCIVCFTVIRNKQNKTEYGSLIIHAIIVVPFIWQLAVIFISGNGIGYEGYTYWIPVVKYAMQQLQTFII